ncbi:DUF2782 domain-containing protein [Cognatilysobacter lacus]|uniref:DUF2782 domain-containing protein n=1 Tax=Cognatilysobacter lacus TaxID=1643323 RepID=A0A5D8Z6L4_9GAMM|nr:DUF2782 domain-containing protein [Lysobacter lacus]TZF89742.1 DUF2782 domain-containing protein [Lysobacter lacus]
MPRSALLLGLCMLAGCASLPADDPTLALHDAQVSTRSLDNGDVVSEYRVAGLLRVVKIVPRGGVTYYLTDDDNDGRLDHRRGDGPVTPVQYKIFGW